MYWFYSGSEMYSGTWVVMLRWAMQPTLEWKGTATAKHVVAAAARKNDICKIGIFSQKT